MNEPTQPNVLTIAGSDPSGGAGIQADLKTIEACRGYGTSVITAITAQNTLGVQGVWEMSEEAVGKQMTCLLEDIQPGAIKTGMLASSPIIRTIISVLRQTYPSSSITSSSSSNTESNHNNPPAPLPPLIIDPVSVSTSKHSLLSPSAIGDLVFGLIPMGRLITPNSLEAEMIVSCIRAGARSGSEGRNEVSHDKLGELINDNQGVGEVKIDGLESMISAGKEILGFMHNKSAVTDGGVEKGVLVKGGHVPLPRSTFRQQLKDVQASSKDADPRVIWNGNSLDAGQGDEEFIEFLAAYRESPFNQVQQDASGSPGKDNKTIVEVQKEEFIVDVLLTSMGDKPDDVDVTLFVAPSIKSRSTHGTGCTLSAAIATHVAHGKTLRESVGLAIEYVQYALITAQGKGQGNGPLNHQCSSVPRTLPLPTLQDPHPFMSYLLRSSSAEWKSYVRHPFVLQLGQGTLPVECFRHYIIQDWHYLRHYARAHALAASKTTDFEEIRAFSEISLHIARESSMHVDFCKSFGVTMKDLLASSESPANFSYSQYILDVGHRGDNLELVVAVLSCLVGYGEVGLYLKRRIDERAEGFVFDGNRYKRWIEDYSGKEFQDAVARGIGKMLDAAKGLIVCLLPPLKYLASLEARIVKEQPSPARLDRLLRIWKDCVRLEANFWQMGMDLA